MKITANEFLFFPLPEDRNCHASHFEILNDGGIYCVFFMGTKEGNGDVRIYGCRRNVDGSWTQPEVLSEDDGVPHWNPVLFTRKNGDIMLFYKVGESIAHWKTYCRISKDNCKTWGEPFELVKGDESGGRGPVRNKAIYLNDGRIIAPASTERGEWKCFFDISCDHGESWERTDDIILSDKHLDRTKELKNQGIIQPSVWQTKDGIHALLRCSEGSIFKVDSLNGKEWCVPYPVNMPNNNSGLDAVLLPDGNLVLACNPVGGSRGKRSPISLYISKDNGMNFQLLTHLSTMPGELSYPAIRYRQGRLHITYTWQRRSIQYFCLEL